MRLSRVLASLLILAVAPALQAASPSKAPPGEAVRPAATRDWSQVVVPTPEGGFRMGNPGAPVKLVEFGSLTCHVCADFSTEGMTSLVRDHVKRGTVSYEFRNLVRDAFDLTAAMLTTCAGPRSFFAMTEELFATQQAWTSRFNSLSQSDIQSLEKMSQADRMRRLATVGGLDALAAKHGLQPAKVQACLADNKRLEQLMEMRRVAFTQYDLQGTPTFLINGFRVENTTSWARLEPQLKPPGQAR